MKYYKICRKMLGDILFEKLVSNLIKKISTKFSEDISLEYLVKILDINISVILMLAISDVMNISKEKIIVPECRKFLVESNLDIMINEYNKYINVIKKRFKDII